MFLFCFDIVLFGFLFLLSDYEKIVFPAILVFFCRVGFKVVYCFSISYFGCCLFFLCCFQF